MPYAIGSGTSGGLGTGQNVTKQGSTTQQQSSGKVLERVKSLTYSASVNKLLLDVEQDYTQTEGSVKTDHVGEIEIVNTGKHPAFAILAYRTWTDESTMTGNTYHVNHLLKPNQGMIIPDCPAIISDETIEQLDGTAVDNQAPNGNMYTEFSDGVADIDSATAAGIVGNATNTTVYLEPYTSAANCSANLFRVGDLIRVRDEVMEVTAIGDKSNLANNYLTVKRDMYGTDGGTAAVDNDNTRLPFFNAYHDYDKYSVAQTDGQGRFKATNFFGYGRSATNIQGITAGSIAIKFYQSGYQTLGLSNITSSTNTGLTASTAYEFDIQVDGGSNFDNQSFTTDSSNLNFGGANGLISLLQSALDAQYYTSGNLFEKKVHVGIVNGDLRFTSGSHLSTSAIALTAGSSGTAEFFGTGRIPAVGSINSAVAAKLPDDVVYDRITYQSSPNANAFMYDDGYGNLVGAGRGTINYETGAIDFTNAPVNAEFVVSCLHTSPFSGRQDATNTAKMNSLKAIYGNMPNQKASGELTITRR